MLLGVSDVGLEKSGGCAVLQSRWSMVSRAADTNP
jgi:hypothetical protein